MSLSNIEVPNETNLFCNILTCNSLVYTGSESNIPYSSPLGGALAGQGTANGFFTQVGNTVTLYMNGLSFPAAGSGPIAFTNPLPVPPIGITNIPIYVNTASSTWAIGNVNIAA